MEKLIKNTLFHCKNYPCDAIPPTSTKPLSFWLCFRTVNSPLYLQTIVHFWTLLCLIGIHTFLFPKHFLSCLHNDIFLRWVWESYQLLWVMAHVWITKIRDYHPSSGFGKVARKWSIFYQECTLTALKVNCTFSCTRKRTDFQNLTQSCATRANCEDSSALDQRWE